VCVCVCVCNTVFKNDDENQRAYAFMTENLSYREGPGVCVRVHDTVFKT